MAYNYYCTHCGQHISQDTVLFNMQNLVLEDDAQSFETFSMYMTLQQINNLIARGTPLENGYRLIRLSFTEVMQIISGGCNLKKPELASLTLEQIREYLRPAMEEAPVVRQPRRRTGGLSFSMKSAMVETDVEDEEEEEAPSDQTAQKEIPPAIQALSTLWGGTAGDQTVEIKIRDELELLKNAFGEQDYIEIQITEYTEEDNQKKPVVVGYQLIYPKSGKHSIYRQRVCPNPECHGSIYMHAGRAEHQTVVFMGTRESGKTSAILAMSHFLHKSMDPIWEKCAPVDQLSFLLDAGHPQLSQELDDFSKGIAPRRTDLRRDAAYSATFWFQNVETGGHLLTLTDMPGELMSMTENPGMIDAAKLLNTHQAALCCDAFVLCFDATTVFNTTRDEDGNPEKQEARNTAKNEVYMLIDKLDQLQRLRSEVAKKLDGPKANTGYVPTMVMITKDVTLENQAEKPLAKSPIPLEKLYCFQAEREFIQANQVYNSVLDTMSKYDKLRKSYHATLRCSPFGYAAPNSLDVKQHNKAYHVPTPKNVDIAIKWLLKLVGILPAAGALETDEGSLSRENYRISRVQYRSDKPKEGEELEEALSRCTLFENPGLFDEQVLDAHTEGFFAKLRLKTSMMAKWIQNDSDPR